MNEEISEMLERKQRAYGQAWKLATAILGNREVFAAFANFVAVTPEYVHNWVIIMSKMMRILTSPENPDHWRDIVGYATLVLDDLTNKRNPSTINNPTKEN